MACHCTNKRTKHFPWCSLVREKFPVAAFHSNPRSVCMSGVAAPFQLCIEIRKPPYGFINIIKVGLLVFSPPQPTCTAFLLRHIFKPRSVGRTTSWMGKQFIYITLSLQIIKMRPFIILVKQYNCFNELISAKLLLRTQLTISVCVGCLWICYQGFFSFTTDKTCYQVEHPKKNKK